MYKRVVLLRLFPFPELRLLDLLRFNRLQSENVFPPSVLIQRLQFLRPSQLCAKRLHSLIAIALNQHVAKTARHATKAKRTHCLLVDQHAGHILPHLMNERGKGLHGQRSADNEKHVTRNHVCRMHPRVLEREGLSIEHDVWLHEIATLASRNAL